MKVSVIIPVYNAQEYLRQCLDSVLAQTLKDIEVICVNDSSTDGSLEILEEYARKDPRVTVVTQPNAGAGAARNRGLSMARGEYLSFLDADDFFEPDMLLCASQKADQEMDDVVVFGSDQYRADAAGAEGSFLRPSWVIREAALPPYQPFDRGALTDNVFKVFVGWAWDKLFRKSFVDQHHLLFQEQRSSNDLLFVFGAVAAAGRIGVLPQVFAHQRRDSADSISKTREKSWHCFYDALQALRLFLKQEDIFEELEKDYINYALHFTLWNYDTLAQPTKELLRQKLNEEWLSNLQILGKGRGYFYQKKEYDHLLELLDEPLLQSETALQAEESQSAARPKHSPAAGAKTQTGKKRGPVRRALYLLSGGKRFDKINQKLDALQKQLAKTEEQNKILREKVDWAHKRNCEFYHDQTRQTADLKRYIGTELNRRDVWPVMADLHRREAAGREIWVIKCPAPDDESKIRWGDYPFALSLKKNLEKLGLYVIVQLREDWMSESIADVVVVLRGSAFYRPDRRGLSCVYLMWNLSHPDQITDEEYALYDAVCVGSRHYAKILQERLSIPVYPLLQCTDTDLFYPRPAETEAGETGSCSGNAFSYIFIGNSRGVARNSVMWAIQDQLPLTMWGSGWNTILAGHLGVIRAPYIENDQIPGLYRSAKVTLNDHWADMLENQFINNRIFDALACGLPVISDTCPELEELFPDAVLQYHNRSEFEACVRRVEEDYPAVKQQVLAVQERIRREFSFEARAKELVAIARCLKKNR